MKGAFNLEEEIVVCEDEKNQKKEKKAEEKFFSKDAFLKSKSFKDKKDLLFVLLQNDKRYSKEEVYSIIDNYLKRRGF